MKSITETGHAKNTANFETLISSCVGFGSLYNPANPALEISQMKTQHATADALIDEVQSSKNLFLNAINKRAILFDALPGFSTRLNNALGASDVPQKTLEDAAGINRKIQGARAGKKKSPPPQPGQEMPSDKSISASQRSMDQMIEHFSEFIDLLSKQPLYKPNEADLTQAACNTRLQQLKQANTEAKNAYTRVNNSRISRDAALYGSGTGLLAVAAAVKRYVKSVFEADSPQYAQVAKIRFKRVTRD